MSQKNEIHLLSKFIFFNEQEIKDLIHMDTIKNLQVYRNNYILQIFELLADYYPTLYKMTGDKLFKDFVLKYSHYTPPKCHSIDQYGQKFYLEIFSKNLKQQKFLSQVAQLDSIFNHPFSDESGALEVDKGVLTYYLSESKPKEYSLNNENIKIKFKKDTNRNVILDLA